MACDDGIPAVHQGDTYTDQEGGTWVTIAIHPPLKAGRGWREALVTINRLDDGLTVQAGISELTRAGFQHGPQVGAHSAR